MPETSAPAYELELASTSEIARPLLPVSVKPMLTETWLTAIIGLRVACDVISPRSTKLAPTRFAAESAASGSLTL